MGEGLGGREQAELEVLMGHQVVASSERQKWKPGAGETSRPEGKLWDSGLTRRGWPGRGNRVPQWQSRPGEVLTEQGWLQRVCTTEWKGNCLDAPQKETTGKDRKQNVKIIGDLNISFCTLFPKKTKTKTTVYSFSQYILNINNAPEFS